MAPEPRTVAFKLALELPRLALEMVALGLDVLTCRSVGHEIVWQKTTIGPRPFCGRCGSQLR